LSAIFQRPLCEMGRAYDFALRPTLGDPGPGFGGGCDTRPHRVEMWAASADPSSASSAWQPFGLCEEHEHQLRGLDARAIQERHATSRFRAPRA
jgi:hypothetical protein